MSKMKKFVTATTTFSVALGIGFVMQYGDAVAARWGADRPVAGPSTQASMIAEIVPVSAASALPTTLMLPDNTGQTAIGRVAVTDIPNEVETPTFEPISSTLETQVVEDVTALPEKISLSLASECDVVLSATPGDMAMVTLSINSPCHSNQIATIHHQGMRFQGVLDENGMMSVDVPSLSPDAFFVATFQDSDVENASTDASDLALFGLRALGWQGVANIDLYDLEFGETENDYLTAAIQ